MSGIFLAFLGCHVQFKKKVCQTDLQNGNSMAKKDKLSKVRMN